MKMIIAMVVLVSSVSSFAQVRHANGRINIGGGRSTVRIEVANDAQNANQNARIRRLEQAVRDLQDQVYDLRDEPQTTIVTTHVCSLETAFDGTFVGRGATEIEAKANARNACTGARAAFCASTEVLCDKVEEVVRIR